MLTGRYEYSLDAKSRVNFPPKFRAEMGEKLYVTKWFDSCLIVYGEKEWQKLDEKFEELPNVKSKELKRIIYGNVQELTPDKQGRILLAQYLKDHASITKDIIIIGVRNYAEIWDRNAYLENEKKNDFARIEQALEEMEF